MVQFVEDGPDIPYEVLEALEEERLVFFCGAGISMPTGLPDFKDLTKQAFEACGVPLAHTKRASTDSWNTAYHKGQYDRALHLLEMKTPAGTMRGAVMNRLTRSLPKGSDLEIHKAILQLSSLQSRRGHRLVTTNFDDRFTLAGLDPADCYESPALPPGRQADCWRAVYLHGRIDRDRDADGHHLVLTSHDFGRAYLSDAWAARFAVELFREFTVLFVGYGVEDPVVTYLLDALTGFRPSLKAFALAGHREGSHHREAADRQWRAKGIRPILFSTGAKRKPDFGLLRATLLEWARHPRSGVEKRIEDALKIGRSPYNEADEASRKTFENLAWLLSEKNGVVARGFAEADPSMHQSWIAPLSTIEFEPRPDEERGYRLLAMPSPPPKNSLEEKHKPERKHHEAPLAGYPRFREGELPLHSATFQLGRWIARHHLDKREAVAWAVEMHGLLHPRMAGLILDRLRDRELTPIPEPYRRFWEILTMAPLGTPGREIFWEREVLRVTEEERKAPLFRQLVAEGAKPFLTVSLARRGPEEGAPTELSDLASFTVRSRDEQFHKDAIRKEPSLLATAGDLLTANLIDALHLHRLASDRFYLRHSSLNLENLETDSKVVNHQNGWELLASACLAAFLGARNNNPEGAGRMIESWIAAAENTGFSILWRLALIAVAEWTESEPDRLALALAGNSGEVMWRRDLQGEILRFLRKRGGAVSETALHNVLSVLDHGPTADHPDWQWGEPEDRKKGAENFRDEALAKLLVGGARLDDQTKILAEACLEDRRKRGIDDDAGEKRHEVEFRSVEPPTAEALVDLEIPEIAGALVKESDAWDAGSRVGDLMERDLAKALDVLDYLATSDEQRPAIWTSALNRLPSQIPKEDAAKAAELCQRLAKLLETNPGVLDATARGISDFLAKVARRLPEGEEEPCFWRLWDLAWQVVAEQEPDVEDREAVTAAINHGAGNLAEALLDRLWRRAGERGSGIPDDLLPRFDALATKLSTAGHLARVILASRLYWLHLRDPNWCRQNLLPRMDWQDQHGEASGLWQGYLWQPGVGESLIRDIRLSLIDLSRHGTDLPERYGENIYGVVGEILVMLPKSLTKTHRRRLFAEMPSRGLAHLAYHLRAKLDASTEKAPVLWRDRIRACFRHWPALLERNTPEVHEALAEMLLATREAFPEAFATLREKNLLGPASRPSSVLYRLEPPERQAGEGAIPYDYVTQHSAETLNLLDAIIPENPERWELGDLREILDHLAEINPALVNTAAYRRLSNLLRRG